MKCKSHYFYSFWVRALSTPPIALLSQTQCSFCFSLLCYMPCQHRPNALTVLLSRSRVLTLNWPLFERKGLPVWPQSLVLVFPLKRKKKGYEYGKKGARGLNGMNNCFAGVGPNCGCGVYLKHRGPNKISSR